MTDNLLPFRRVSSSKRSDALLLSACAEGDRTALDELFRRHGDRVRRILVRLRYIHSSDLDDVLQSTFLEVYRSCARFTGRAAVGTWIIGIAMNVVRHYVRSETRRKSALSVVARGPVLRQNGADEQISRRQLLAKLEAGFESLSHEHRVVFTLCDLEEMKSIEVARILNIAEGTVWRRLHDARQHLRRHVSEEPGR